MVRTTEPASSLSHTRDLRLKLTIRKTETDGTKYQRLGMIRFDLFLASRYTSIKSFTITANFAG
jgi:hypothetical protein